MKKTSAKFDASAMLNPFVENRSLAGAVAAVVDKRGMLSLDTVGYSDIAAGKRMKSDAVFWIASMSKPITCTALMMLVDEKKLRVLDPVEKYLPEFKGQWLVAEQDADYVLLKKPRHPITVANVLSHTSGMPFSTPVEAPTLDRLPLRTAIRSYAMTPLQFEPDTKYQYSNCGTNTAGCIIEAVSGVPYEKFMQERLFEPLGMKDTTFWPNAAQVRRIPKAYKPDAKGSGLEEFGQIAQLSYPLDDRNNRFPMPAGGLFSTAADVALFCRMLLNGGVFKDRRYISEKSIRQMTVRFTAPELPESYGFGWAVEADNFSHGGALATNMRIFPKKGLAVIYLVQHAGFPGEGGKSLAVFTDAAVAAFGR